MDDKHKKNLEEYKTKAEEYIRDREKAEELLRKTRERARKNKGPLDEVWEDLHLLFDIFEDWIKGRYKEIPKGSIIAIIAGLLYFLSPIDIVPDFLPIAGFIDDAAVLALVVSQIKGDLNKYREWWDRQAY